MIRVERRLNVEKDVKYNLIPGPPFTGLKGLLEDSSFLDFSVLIYAVGVWWGRSYYPGFLIYPMIKEGQRVRENISNSRFNHHTPKEATCVWK